MGSEAPIALDVTAVVVGNTGVARYATALPNALEDLGVDLRRFAVGRGKSPDSRIRHLRVPVRVMGKVWACGHPRAERIVGEQVSLVHSLDLVPPPSKVPTVVTVHDVGALERPDLHSDRSIRAAHRQLAAASRVDAVCAVSEATRQALIERGVNAERIHLTPNAATGLPPALGPSVREPGYVLVVGMVTPRKGFDVVVRALEQLPDTRLVIVGPDGFRAEETLALIKASPARDRIDRLGFVSDATLSVLIRDAGCEVVPSRIEGFGIPLLEAMTQGIPLVCSDIPALHEVGGTVPFFVPVDDVDATAAGIRQALAEPKDSDRITSGLDVASAYTWERSARATAQAYTAVLGRSVVS